MHQKSVSKHMILYAKLCILLQLQGLDIASPIPIENFTQSHNQNIFRDWKLVA